MTQEERVLRYLEQFGSITSLEAFQALGITRLAAVIHKMAEKGYTFRRVAEPSKNRYGQTVLFVRYYLS